MAMADQMLEKIDIIRARFPISYREAHDLLDRNGGNVVRALMEAEEAKSAPGIIERVEERVTVLGSEVADKLQEIVRKGQHTKIRVLRDGRTVLTLPAAVGAVGALFFPYLTVFATVAAMTQKYEIVWDKRMPQQQQKQPQPAVIGHSDADTGHECALVNVHDETKEPEFCAPHPLPGT